MYRKILKFTLFSFLVGVTLTGCKTNYLLHKNITKDKWKHLVECNKLTDCDTFRLSGRTIGVKLEKNHIAVGNILNGRKVGKWYYYTVNDTIDCYRTEVYQMNDTLVDNIRLINPKYF